MVVGEYGVGEYGVGEYGVGEYWLLSVKIIQNISKHFVRKIQRFRVKPLVTSTDC
jgi:hypothetical protein